MRILALPAALLLGAALHTLVPGAKTWINQRLCMLPGIIEQNAMKRRQHPDPFSTLFIYVVGLVIFPLLISILHPICAAIVMAPLFSGFSPLPAASKTKQELDSGSFSKNAAEYERRVLAACAPLGDSFAFGVCTPLLLCALGMILHIGGALGWLYMGLCAVRETLPAAHKFLRPAENAGEIAFTALLLLCAGLVGRNPLHIGGHGAGEKLMHVLSLDGEIDHAPISGDITQAAFLCLLSTGLLCTLLTGVGFFLI